MTTPRSCALGCCCNGCCYLPERMLRLRKLLPATGVIWARTLRLLNALNSEDRGLKVRFSLATIAFDRESAQMSQILSSQGKNAPSDPYPHYLVRLAASRFGPKVASRVRKWVPGPFRPRGPKSPKQSRKRVKIVEK